MKRLAYIVFMILVVAAQAVAQESYEIDVVCQSSERYYRADGEKGSKWKWMLSDVDHNPIALEGDSGVFFAALDINGDSIWGSEIAIGWAVDTGIYYLAVEQTSIFGCDSAQLGYVHVIPGPEAFAGDDLLACASDIVSLDDAWALNHSRVMWTAFGGDGEFIDSSQIQAVYVPGPGDLAAGSVTLTMVALGQGNAGGCDPAVSSVIVTFSDPQVTVEAVNPTCNDASIGSAVATATNGIQPYSFAWAGPGGFTAETNEITGLDGGMYYLTVTDSLGCIVKDSVEIVQPDALVLAIDSIAHNLCYGDSNGVVRVLVTGGTGNYTYSWNTVPVQTDSMATGLAAGEYIVTVTDIKGCEAQDTVVINEPEELLASITGDITGICETDTVYLNSTVSGGTGNYTHSWAGDQYLNFDATDVSSPHFSGAAAGTYSLFYQVVDENGCTAEDTLVIEIYGPTVSVSDTTICHGAPDFGWNGQTIVSTRDSIYQQTLSNAEGCDSLMTLNVIIIEPTVHVSDTTICQGAPDFAWNGQTIVSTRDSIYQETILNAEGCDSLMTLNVFILEPTVSVSDTTLCQGAPDFAWNGQTIVSSRDSIYQETLSNADGCDSLMTLNVIIIEPTVSVSDTTICQGAPDFAWNGQTIVSTRDSIYQQTLSNADGCDSLMTLNVIIIEPTVSISDTTICQGAPDFAWNGQTIVSSRDSIYQQTLSNADGCDSLMTLNVFILEPTVSVSDTTICQGAPDFAWNSQTIVSTRDSIYQQTLSNADGCDSLLTLNVIILEPTVSISDTTICQGAPDFAWNGQTIVSTRDSIYQETISNADGCDSIMTLNVIFIEPTVSISDTTICQGAPDFAWNGQTVVSSRDSIYQETLSNADGCDSLMTLNVFILPEFRDTIPMTVCVSELPIDWYGQSIAAAGFYEHTLQSLAGCDSILTLELEVVPEFRDTIPMTACVSELPIDWYGQSIAAAGFYEHTLQSLAGCDSILTLELEVVPEFRDTIPMTECETELPIDWYGQLITAAGFYEQTLISLAGCDSILVLVLELDPQLPVSVTITANREEVMPGETVTFTADPVNGGSDPLYTWYVNGVEQADAGSETFAYEPIDGDEVYVMLTSSEDCTSGNPAASNVIILTVGSPSFECPPVVELGCRPDELPQPYASLTEFIANGGNAENYRENTFAHVSDVSDGNTCPETITRTYMIMDKKGNTLICGQLIIINDTIKPEISIDPKVVACIGEIPPVYSSFNEFKLYGGTATDECALDESSFTYTGEVSDGNTCPEIITRTYAIADMCGNLNDVQEIITVHDTIPPQIVSCPDSLYSEEAGMTVELLSGLPYSDIELPIVLADTALLGIGAADNCEIREITYMDEAEGTCLQVITRTFTVYDGCGNINTCTQNITIYQESVPVFDPVGPLCQFEIAPALPDTSLNGVSGTWYPSVIDTDMADTLQFVFTPAAGQCAVNDTLEVVVIEQIKGVFDFTAEICQFDTPPALPATDVYGVTGTWVPDTIDAGKFGLQVFVFTPDTSLYSCYDTTQITIEVIEFISPVLAEIGPLCQFEEAPVLPATDMNGVSGTWSPALIPTDVPDTLQFVFTPIGYSCFEPDTIEVIIREHIVPEFNLISEICQFETPPALPSTDVNGISGTWSPAEINTSEPGPATYIFTPDESYGCFEPYSWTINIDTLIIPQFEPMGPFCQDSEAPALPEANFNGVTGTWSPAVINTSVPGTHPYVFTPEEDIRCAETFTLWIEIMPTIVPEFDPVGPICLDAVAPALPLISVNGVTGTWEPAVIRTDSVGIFTYVFMPDSTVDCAIGEILTVEIISNTPPVAENDYAITLQDEAVDVDVTVNDTDSNGAIDARSVTVISEPENGKARVHPVTGIVTYTPERGFIGTDSLVYSVCDDGIPCGPMCDTAIVIITVKVPNQPPVAVNDSFSVMCYPLIEYLLPNDYDPDDDNIRIVQWPMVDAQNGTVTIEHDGAFVYMPDKGFVGIDTFIYRIYDDGYPEMWDEAMVWINVLPEVDCDNLPGDDDDIPTECALMIPDGFSPNGDGVHDFFQIFCIEKHPEATLRIFDRGGNKLFQKHNYGNLDYWGSDENAWWWGISQHKLTLGRGTLPSGTYLYVLELGNGEVRTGTVMIAY